MVKRGEAKTGNRGFRNGQFLFCRIADLILEVKRLGCLTKAKKS